MVVYPGLVVWHYMLFLVATMGILTAIVFGNSWEALSTLPQEHLRRARISFLTVFTLTCLVPQAVTRIINPNPMLGALTGTQTISPMGTMFPANPKQHRMPASIVIAGLITRNEPIALWGWMTKLYVETDASFAGRAMCAFWEIPDSPLRDHFRERFLDDIKATNPPVFVDVVGPTSFHFTDRSLQGHENFPALRELITRSYTMIVDIDSVRIFVRNDRLSSSPEALKSAASKYRDRGIVAANAKNYPNALSDLAISFQLQPSAEALATHGTVLLQSGQEPEGLGEIERALAEKPELYYPRFVRACHRYKTGDYYGALTDIREALRFSAQTEWQERREAETLETQLKGVLRL
jgi:hypothetical protein